MLQQQQSTNVVTYPFLERGSAVWVPHARHPDQNVKDTLAKQRCYNNNNKQFTRKNNRIALLRAEESRGTENPTGEIDSVLQYAPKLRFSPLLSQNLQANGVESVIVPRNEWRHWHDHSWTGMIWSQVNPFLFSRVEWETDFVCFSTRLSKIKKDVQKLL